MIFVKSVEEVAAIEFRGLAPFAGRNELFVRTDVDLGRRVVVPPNREVVAANPVDALDLGKRVGHAMQMDGAQTRARLRMTHALPEIEGVDWVRGDNLTVGWDDDSPAEIDVRSYEELIAAGKRREAAELYRGDFLDGFYEDHVLAEREQLGSIQDYRTADRAGTRGSREARFRGSRKLRATLARHRRVA